MRIKSFSDFPRNVRHILIKLHYQISVNVIPFMIEYARVVCENLVETRSSIVTQLKWFNVLYVGFQCGTHQTNNKWNESHQNNNTRPAFQSLSRFIFCSEIAFSLTPSLWPWWMIDGSLCIQSNNRRFDCQLCNPILLNENVCFFSSFSLL